MYGEEESDEPHDHANGSLGFGEDNGGSGGGEEEYSGFHLNEFMQLTDKDDEICHFRTFKVVNYSRIDSQSRLIELIRTASSAILRDLHQRFSAKNLHAIQALAAMWDPTQFPRSGGEAALFANRQVQTLASQLSRTYKAHTTGDLGVGDNALPSSKQALSGTLLIDPVATLREWSVFKAEVHQQVESELGVSATPTTRFVSGQIQVAYRKRLFSEGALAPSRRRLRSVEDSHVLNSAPSTDTCKKFGNLTKLAAAWNVLPLALSTDLHLFRRLYERQLARICREQAENKLQSINFDIGDTFSELLSRLSSPNSRSVKKKVTVYDLLQNSKVEVEQSARSLDKPVLEFELSGVTVDYFLRSIDAVTMALDHRLRLLSLEFTESPVALTRTPGGCPKWLQNAMRGYWKLACRPPKIARASTAVASVSNGVRHRACTSSHNTTASGGGPWSASTTSQTSEHHLHEAESLLHAGKWSMSTGTGGSGNIASGGSTSSSSTNTGGRAVPAMISPADRQVSCVPLPLPPLPVANSAQPAGQGCVVDTGPLGVLSANATADQVPMSISVSASAQSVATADFSSLPLLEALLSDSTQALRNPAVLSSQRTFLTSALPDSMLPPLAHGVGIKRPLDKESAAVAVRPISQADHGSEIRQQSTNDADIQAAKRMRQSLSSRPIMPAEPYSGGGGLDYQQAYQCPNGFFQQQQQQRHAALMSGAQEGSDLGTAIARMASNMGLDSVSTQALAASLSTQIIQQRSTQIDNSAAMYFGGGGRETDEINLQSDYASQFGYASQATVLNMHGLSGLPSAPVSSSQGRPSTLNSALPVGHPSTATAASFDQMIRERHVQNGHYPPPSLAQLSNASMAVLPPGSLDYQMRGFLRDNNSQ
ncbi:hypothetical protein H4R26_002895 [Coemansia thaxteri]|uniref:Uncharacterized protein n=1 Tax=Coemansia thaxteri TaxID=2663907 RepID=A0A9W8BC62_9FUNG|nr:hypothetical protein H4R26_002895 [Coemansia thaxteri]